MKTHGSPEVCGLQTKQTHQTLSPCCPQEGRACLAATNYQTGESDRRARWLFISDLRHPPKLINLTQADPAACPTWFRQNKGTSLTTKKQLELVNIMLSKLVQSWPEHKLIVLCDYDPDLRSEKETIKREGNGYTLIHKNIINIMMNNE